MRTSVIIDSTVVWVKVLEKPTRGQTSFHLWNHEVICSSSSAQNIYIIFNTGHTFDKLLAYYLNRLEHIRSFGGPESAKLLTSQCAFRDNSVWLWRMILKQLNGEIALVYYVSLLSSLLTQHEKCEESEGYWKTWLKQNADPEIKVRSNESVDCYSERQVCALAVWWRRRWVVKANPRATTLESLCLSFSSSKSCDILTCHLSHSTSHGHILCSHPVAMREHKHASEHILYWPRAATHCYRHAHEQKRES